MSSYILSERQRKRHKPDRLQQRPWAGCPNLRNILQDPVASQQNSQTNHRFQVPSRSDSPQILSPRRCRPVQKMGASPGPAEHTVNAILTIQPFSFKKVKFQNPRIPFIQRWILSAAE